jgi:hypothetical protein
MPGFALTAAVTDANAPKVAIKVVFMTMLQGEMGDELGEDGTEERKIPSSRIVESGIGDRNQQPLTRTQSAGATHHEI